MTLPVGTPLGRNSVQVVPVPVPVAVLFQSLVCPPEGDLWSPIHAHWMAASAILIGVKPRGPQLRRCLGPRLLAFWLEMSLIRAKDGTLPFPRCSRSASRRWIIFLRHFSADCDRMSNTAVDGMFHFERAV